MNIKEIAEELSKLKYQLHVIADTIDYQTHPIEALIMSMDWGENDLNRAHDIFEKYDDKLHAKEDVNWREFESELKKEFDISYQTVKSIVNAFYQNHQWTSVCYGYAMSFEPSTPIEFHHITRTKDNL